MLRLTREDANRLINDLPKVCKELTKEEYRKVHGRDLRVGEEIPLKVANVCLAFVRGKAGLTPEFVVVDSPLIEVVIFNIVDAKTLAERYYRGVKERKKGEMQAELYRAANGTLSKDIKVDYNALVVGILELRKNFDELYEAFEPICIFGNGQEYADNLCESALGATKGTLTLRVRSLYGTISSGVLMPTKEVSRDVKELFSMIYNEARGYFINGLYGMNSNHSKALIKTEDVGELKVKLKHLDIMTLDALRKLLVYNNEVVSEVRKEYEELAKKAQYSMSKVKVNS